MTQTSAATTPAARNQGRMATFTGKAIVTVNQGTIDHQSTAHARTQRVHGKMFHSFGTPIDHFTNGCGVGIIGQCDGGKGWKFGLNKVNQGNNTFERQIGGMLDGT